MVTYIATLYAKPGHELEVTKFYQDQEQQLRQAKGYRGRKMLRARPGTMEAEVRRVVPPEQLVGGLVVALRGGRQKVGVRPRPHARYHHAIQPKARISPQPSETACSPQEETPDPRPDYGDL